MQLNAPIAADRSKDSMGILAIALCINGYPLWGSALMRKRPSRIAKMPQQKKHIV